eukprot:EG_transcript_44429
MGNKEIRERLAIIELEKGQPSRQIKKVFKEMDKNDDGFIDGTDFAKLIDEVTDYVLSQYKRQGAPPLDRDAVHSWVAQRLDRTSSRKLSVEDLQTQLRDVLLIHQQQPRTPLL